MGIGNYFRPKKATAASTAHDEAHQMSEKASGPSAGGSTTPARPRPISSRPASIRSSYAASTHSHGSAYLDSIKHEIMVNYLFQQQCANLWIVDSSGAREGVVLRKSRDNYLACPPALAESSFAKACAELNVMVCFVPNPFNPPSVSSMGNSIIVEITFQVSNFLLSGRVIPRWRQPFDITLHRVGIGLLT